VSCACIIFIKMKRAGIFVRMKRAFVIFVLEMNRAFVDAWVGAAAVRWGWKGCISILSACEGGQILCVALSRICVIAVTADFYSVGRASMQHF
jgi:hypothetical protein